MFIYFHLGRQTSSLYKNLQARPHIRLCLQLARRPTIKELEGRNILQFIDLVEVLDVEQCDRQADKPWTRLTAEDKTRIRQVCDQYMVITYQCITIYGDQYISSDSLDFHLELEVEFDFFIEISKLIYLNLFDLPNFHIRRN